MSPAPFFRQFLLRAPKPLYSVHKVNEIATSLWHLMPIGWQVGWLDNRSVGCSVGRSVIISLKGRKLHFHASIGVLVRSHICKVWLFLIQSNYGEFFFVPLVYKLILYLLQSRETETEIKVRWFGTERHMNGWHKGERIRTLPMLQFVVWLHY